MSFIDEYNKAVGWAEYLGLPKIFAKMSTSARASLPTLPTPRVFKEEAARTPTSKEVRSEFLPIVVVPPQPLTTGAESSVVTPLRCQMPVNRGMWTPQKVVEKPGILLQK